MKEDYPKAVSRDWLTRIGVEKESLKKIENLFEDDHVNLNEQNLVLLQQKAINVRLISTNLFTPVHQISINQETSQAWSEFLVQNRESFDKFFYHTNVKESRETYNRKQKIAWKQCVASDYKEWNEYQENISIHIKSFDNRTYFQQKSWEEEVGEARNTFRTVIAKGMVEIIDGQAPVSSVDKLSDFGFKTYQRDYVWMSLGRDFAVTRFNMKKVMSVGLKLKDLVNTPSLHDNEPTSFLKSVRYGEEASMFDRQGLYLTREEETAYMKGIFMAAAKPQT